MAQLGALSRLNNSKRGSAALLTILTYNKILNFLNQTSGFELAGTSDRFVPINADSTMQNRAIGAAYTPSNLATEDPVNYALKVYGGAVNIDISHIADMERGLGSYDFETRLKKEYIRFAKAYEIALMTGTGATTAIAGLSKLLDGTDLPGYTGITRLWSGSDFAEADTLDISLSQEATVLQKNIDLFLEMMSAAVGEVDNPKGILVNSTMYHRMTTIGRKAGILDTDRSLFGVPIPTFNNVPLIKLSKNAISDTEPDGAALTPPENNTSIYILSPSEFGFSLATNSGLEYWEHPKLEAKEAGQEKFEIRASWKVENPDCVLRINHIKAVNSEEEAPAG